MSAPKLQPTYRDAPGGNTFERGIVFQDFVIATLSRHYNFHIQLFGSRQYQLEHGESMQRAEIKLDDTSQRTGRLSIEVAEKSRRNMPTWTPSGIYAREDTIFYIQGHYQMFWVFDIKVLRRLHDRLQNDPENGDSEFNGTIRRFFLPQQHAAYYAILQVEC